MTDFTGAVAPDLATFRALARERRVIPVVRRLLADGVTAVGLFEALCGDRAGTFLLESAEQGRNWSRYSFIGVRCAAMLTQRGDEAVWLGRAPRGVPGGGSAVEALRDTIDLLRTDPLPGLPPLTGGLVGYLTYDAVRAWERVPDDNPDELGIPDVGFLLATDLAVLDHADGSVLLIANAINYDASDERVDDAWRDAVARLDGMQAELDGSADRGDLDLRRLRPHRRALLDAGRCSTCSRWMRRRSTSGRAMPSRSSSPSDSRRPAPPPPWTCTGSCGPPTRVPTCT